MPLILYISSYYTTNYDLIVEYSFLIPDRNMESSVDTHSMNILSSPNSMASASTSKTSKGKLKRL